MPNSNFKNKEAKDLFTKHLMEMINKVPEDMRRSAKYGITISFAMATMRDTFKWTNLGTLNDFWNSVRECGFQVVPALKKNGSEHRTCQVIIPR